MMPPRTAEHKSNIINVKVETASELCAIRILSSCCCRFCFMSYLSEINKCSLRIAGGIDVKFYINYYGDLDSVGWRKTSGGI